MNENTGELRRAVKDGPLPGDFVLLPEELWAMAREFMAAAEARGEKAIVPLEGDSPLSKFRRDLLARKAKAKARNRKRNKAARKQRHS